MEKYSFSMSPRLSASATTIGVMGRFSSWRAVTSASRPASCKMSFAAQIGKMDELHQAHTTAVDVPPTRRVFYIGFINGVMGLIGLALAAPAAIYLLFPPKVRKEAEWVKTADLSKIPDGPP